MCEIVDQYGRPARDGLSSKDARHAMCHAKRRSQDEESTFTLRQFMTGVVSAGIGAFINHISGNRYIYFFVWIAISTWGAFHLWSMGKWWRRWYLAISFILLAATITLFIYEAPNRAKISLNMRVNGRRGKVARLTNDFLIVAPENELIPVKPDEISGSVIVPVPASTTNFPLLFGLEPSESDIVGDIGVKVFLPTENFFGCDSNFWFEQPDDIAGFSAIAAPRESINPISGAILKPITITMKPDASSISPVADISVPILLLVTVASPHSVPAGYEFPVICVRLNGVTNFDDCPEPFVARRFKHGKAFSIGLNPRKDAKGKWSIETGDPYPQFKIIYPFPP